MNRAPRTLLLLAWLGALAWALSEVSERTRAYGASERALVDVPPLATLDRRIVEVATLGYRNLYDDFASIWLMQFLVDERLRHVPVDDVVKAVHAVTRLGPTIESLYVLSCVAMFQEFDHPEKCEAITKEAVHALPNNWRMPAMQGYVCAYKLSDNACAAAYYLMAGSRPGAPPFLAAFGGKLARKESLDPKELDATIGEIMGQGLGSHLNELMQDKHAQEQHEQDPRDAPKETPPP